MNDNVAISGERGYDSYERRLSEERGPEKGKLEPSEERITTEAIGKMFRNVLQEEVKILVTNQEELSLQQRQFSVQQGKLKEQLDNVQQYQNELHHKQAELIKQQREFNKKQEEFYKKMSLFNRRVEAYLPFFYAELHKELDHKLNLRFSNYCKVASIAIKARFGVNISAKAISGAILGGGAGAVVGGLGASFVLPIVGTLGGSLTLGLLGSGTGAIIGAGVGVSTSITNTIVDFHGWRDMRIYQVYHEKIMEKLLQEEELQKFICPLDNVLMWKPCSVSIQGEDQPSHYNWKALKLEWKKPEEDQFSTLRKSFEEEQNIEPEGGSMEDVSLEDECFPSKMYDGPNRKKDKDFHKQLYKALKKVAQKHKLAIPEYFPHIRRALDLITETYHPSNFGKNPDDIEEINPNTFWRWFCTYRNYKKISPKSEYLEDALSEEIDFATRGELNEEVELDLIRSETSPGENEKGKEKMNKHSSSINGDSPSTDIKNPPIPLKGVGGMILDHVLRSKPSIN